MKKILIICLLANLSMYLSAQTETDKNKMLESLLDADIQFSELSLEKGMNHAFLKYCDDQGVLLRDNHFPVIGIDSIRRVMLAEPDTSFVLIWEPLAGYVAGSGELGYTYGIYTFYYKSEPTRKYNGTYVTIWEKSADGSWKFVLDSGNQGLGEESSK